MTRHHSKKKKIISQSENTTNATLITATMRPSPSALKNSTQSGKSSEPLPKTTMTSPDQNKQTSVGNNTNKQNSVGTNINKQTSVGNNANNLRSQTSAMVINHH